MRHFAAAFLPNRALSKRDTSVVVIAWVVLAFIVWTHLPYVTIPRPFEVLAALGDLWTDQGLSRELWTSFVLNVQALAVGGAISLVLAYATVLPVFRPLVVAIAKGRFLALAGLTFLFTVVVGGGHPLKLSLLVFGITVFFITSMADIVANIPKDKFDHARTLRMSEWRVVWDVVILGTFDQALSALRQNAAIGWMMLTMVEGISRAEGGVGAMLLNQDKHFHLADVFAIQLLMFLVGLVQDYGIGVTRHLICPYADLALERK